MDLYTVGLVALGALQLADIATTQGFRSRGVREGNPVIRKLMNKCGNCWIIFKVLVAAGFLYGFYAIERVWFVEIALALVIVAYAYAVVTNFRAGR